MAYQISSILLILICIIPIYSGLFFFGRLIIERVSKKVRKADDDELRREDDVLLQAVAFSQTLLFFFVNLTLEEQVNRLTLSVLIAGFASTFYILRAWAKIKDNPKFRYYSMYVLSLVLGNTVLVILVGVTSLIITFDLTLEYPHIVILFMFLYGIGKVVRQFIQKIFTIRYGYD